MKRIFNMLVMDNDTARLESLLNSLRIGLNDWDKSKTFNIQNIRLINYTIICEEDVFTYIVSIMNGTRVY